MAKEYVNDKAVDEIASMASLSYEGEEKKRIKDDLNMLIAFISLIDKTDTEGLEPLRYIHEEGISLADDCPAEAMKAGELLNNAPKTDGTYIILPNNDAAHD